MIEAQKAYDVLALLSQAWGPTDHEGYCFFPWIDREVGGFHTKAFKWPEDRVKIVDHLIEHEHHDLYWCPMLFEEPKRQTTVAHEEYCLWADLDEVDPRKIERRWKPTVAWQTSPGRYQALWLLKDPESEDLFGASRRGADNHRMTHMVGADPSGWDTTQLLRIPGWYNHKPDYVTDGHHPQGKLLWNNGPRYHAQQFDSLPMVVDGELDTPTIDLKVLDDIDLVDVAEVMDRLKFKIPKATREKFDAVNTESDKGRSDTMFYLMRVLADERCTLPEIIAVIRSTVWDKFRTRPTHYEDLIREAQKAISQRRPDPDEVVDFDIEPIGKFIARQKPPTWLVKDLLVSGSVGFIAGEPKTRKSWVALDLAVSVAMNYQSYGTKFLNHFRIDNPGPVLYLALEDGGWLIKERVKKIWKSKVNGHTTTWKLEHGVPVGGNPPPDEIDLKLAIAHGIQFDLSKPDTVSLLQQKLRLGYPTPHGDRERYKLVIVDTFMRAAGNVKTNDTTEMMSLLDPLTKLARREGVNILLVHHFNKSKQDTPARGGSRMLGSQAFHAWAEDSIYLTAAKNQLKFEVESKTAPDSDWLFDLDPTNRTWAPTPHTGASATEMDFAAVDKPKLPVTQRLTLKALVLLGDGDHHISTVGARAAHDNDNDNLASYAKTNLDRLAEKGHIISTAPGYYRLP